MPYDDTLADIVRAYLFENTEKSIDEKSMFGGLAFLVDGKMCINISDDNLMVRYDPAAQTSIENKYGFLPMEMKGRQMKGYGYVAPEGFRKKVDFEYWMQLCLAFNPLAKSSKKKKK